MTPIEKDAKDTNSSQKPKVNKRFVKYAFLAFFAIMISGFAITLYYYLTSPSTHAVICSVFTHEISPQQAFPGREYVNILLMGRDVDRDRRGRIIHSRGRTDCMLLAHVDFRNRHVNILSIPRDTLTRIPGYRGRRRISYANALGGPELAKKAVAELTAVPVDHYVLINFEGFEKAIDAIGGLEVTVDKQLDYDDNWGNLHIHLKPGRQTLNGEQAMGFVRYRQSNSGEGESDFVRISRQHEFLRAARAKLADPQALLRLPRVLDTVASDTQSSLTMSQMLCLAAFAKSLPSSSIRMETLPAISKNTIFVKADPDATEKLVQELFLQN